MFNLGLNVIEVEGKATPSIQAAPTSVAGIIIGSQRGVPGKVVRLSNWSQFVHRFGTHTKDYYGAYAIRGFFDNGGSIAYVSRVVNEGVGVATSASIELELINTPLQIENGAKLAFIVSSNDEAETYVAEFIHNPSVYSATPGETISLQEDNEMTVTINEVEEKYVFLPTDFAGSSLANITDEEFSDVINQKFSGIKAWIEGNELKIRTDRGDDVGFSVLFTGDGFNFEKVNGGHEPGNVAHLHSVTLNEVKRVIEDVILADVATVEIVNNKIKVTLVDELAGSHNALTIDESQLDSVHEKFTISEEPGEDANTSNVASAAFKNIELTDNSSITVEAGCCGEPDPGEWGRNVSVMFSKNADYQNFIDLAVTYKDQNGKDQNVENHIKLSMDPDHQRYIADIINDDTVGSNYIRITNVSGTEFEDAIGPENLDNEGSDGAMPTSSQYAAQIPQYESVDIQLLCCPETYEEEFIAAAKIYCQSKGDRMFVGHTKQESGSDPDTIKADHDYKEDIVYGALYFPWIQVVNPSGGRKWVPPSGHILGVYARTERERGVWKAPAGNAAVVRGALDIKYHINDTDHTTLVKSAGINAVRYVPGQGIIVDSSRTLSSNTLWLYVNVRLLFNFVKSSLKSGLHWVVQEPNNEELRQKVKYNSITPFLMGLWRRGAFGPGSPEEVFTVVIDDGNNTSQDIQQGIFNADVYFYPSRPAETIIIRVGQQEGGGSATES